MSNAPSSAPVAPLPTPRAPKHHLTSFLHWAATGRWMRSVGPLASHVGWVGISPSRNQEEPVA